MAMYKTRNAGTGNGMRGTRGTRGMGGMLYSGECHQTFPGMSPNIPGNVIRHSGECHQTFRGMSSDIPGNVIKHSRECPQTFREILPIYGVKEDNYWAGSHLECCQTSMKELF